MLKYIVLFMFVSVLFWSEAAASELSLTLRSRQLVTDNKGCISWQLKENKTSLHAQETAVIIIDVWNKHWSKGAMLRTDKIVPSINDFLSVARKHEVLIIHAPAGTVRNYEENPARQRAKQYADKPTQTSTFDSSLLANCPIPIPEGSDTFDEGNYPLWTKQHPGILIDSAKDFISQDPEEIFAILKKYHIKNVLVCGLHANICVLVRPYGLIALQKAKYKPIIIRDLTEALSSPQNPPYVSIEEATRLSVEYIEKFWGPSVDSRKIVWSK